MKRILVLGANGFIGSQLTQRLLSDHFVIGYDALDSHPMIYHENYRHISADYCTEKDFSRILKDNGVSVVYHLISTTTPCNGTQHVEQEVNSNILPTLRLLEACVECNVKQFIFPSSGGTVYGEGSSEIPHLEDERLRPVCSYGIQKQSIESYLLLYQRMHGMNTIIARIANPYGPGAQEGRTQGVIPIMIRKLINNEAIELYGETYRDYLYIDDLIDALTKLLQYTGKKSIFNIGSGESIFLPELIRQIEIVVGRTFNSIHKEKLRLCDVKANCLDISLAKQEIGWSPQISLKEGITKTFFSMYPHLERKI